MAWSSDSKMRGILLTGKHFTVSGEIFVVIVTIEGRAWC